MFSRSATAMLSRRVFTAARQPLSRSAAPSFAAPVSSSIIQQTQQRRLLSDQTRSAISKAVASAPVVLFMKGTPETPQCGFSRAAIQILGITGVNPEKFAAFNVLEDSELREGIKEFSDWPTIPQLYVEEEFVGGCDILVGMHKSGELVKMLEQKGLVVEAETDSQA